MKDFLRKTWFFGLGLLDFTTEKVEALAEEMVKRGELSQQESSQVVEQLMAKAEEAQKAFCVKVKDLIDKSLTEMKLARAADLEALEKRVAALEDKLQSPPGPEKD